MRVPKTRLPPYTHPRTFPRHHGPRCLSPEQRHRSRRPAGRVAIVLEPGVVRPPLSICREKSGRPDLNRGPHRPERCALPGCATPRWIQYPTATWAQPVRTAAQNAQRLLFPSLRGKAMLGSARTPAFGRGAPDEGTGFGAGGLGTPSFVGTFGTGTPSGAAGGELSAGPLVLNGGSGSLWPNCRGG